MAKKQKERPMDAINKVGAFAKKDWVFQLPSYHPCFFIELSCFSMRLSHFADVVLGAEHPPMCFILQEAAQERPRPPPARGPHHHLLLLTFSLHPALLQPSIWPPTLSMLAAGRVSFATSTCLIILLVPEATWQHCRATQGWVTGATTGYRAALLLPRSPLKPSCLRGLPPWSQECQLLPPCPATARWRHTVASWDPSLAPSFSMSCKQATLPPPPPLHTCLVVATCSRAPTMPSLCTIPTTFMDTISLLLPGWRQAPRNSPPPKALYSALPHPAGPLERGNTFPQGWITGCTWSALPPATSRRLPPVTTGSMEQFRAPPHRCLYTWSNKAMPLLGNKGRQTFIVPRGEPIPVLFCLQTYSGTSIVMINKNISHQGVCPRTF